MPRRIVSPMVGRLRELSVLVTALSEVADDGGRVVLISGEAGIGKTRLVEELGGRASAIGFTTIVGRCIPNAEEVLPFAPLIDIVRQLTEKCGEDGVEALRSDAAAVLAPLGIAGADDRPPGTKDAMRSSVDGPVLSRLILATFSVLRDVAARRRLIVVFEDLHWADRSSIGLFEYLARNVDRLGALCIGTFRSDEVHRRHPLRPVATELARRDVEVVMPGPLTAEDLGALAAGVQDDAVRGGDDLEVLQRRSGGNPFLALELLRAPARGQISREVRDLVLERAERLGPDACRALALFAVAGPQAPAAVVAAALGTRSVPFADLLRGLVEADLLTRQDEFVSFRHELLREIIDDELLASDRAALHVLLADAFEKWAPQKAGEISYHWSRAGDQEKAFQAAVVAARRAQRTGAGPEAAALFDRADGLWARVRDPEAAAGATRAALRLEAARACYSAGDIERAIRLARDVALSPATADCRVAVAALCCVTQWLGWAALPGAEEVVDRVLRIVPEQPDSAERVEVLVQQSMIHRYAGRLDESAAAADAALVMAGRIGGDGGWRNARRAHAMCVLARGDESGIAALGELLESAVADRDSENAATVYLCLTHGLRCCGRHDAVIDEAEAGRAYIEREGLEPVQGSMIAVNLLYSLTELGRWDEVERLAATLRRDALDHRLGPYEPESIGLVALRRGRLAEAAAMIGDVLPRKEQCTVIAAPLAATAMVELALAQGATDVDVPSLVDAALSRSTSFSEQDAVELVSVAGRWHAEHVAASTGNRDVLAGRALDDLDRWEATVRSLVDALAGPGAIPDVSVLFAEIDAERHRIAGVAVPGEWATLAEQWNDRGRPFRAARCWEREATRPGAPPSDPSVRRAIGEALPIARRLRAAPMVERLSALAAHAGMADLDMPHASDGPAGLTPREREVLQLVAEGSTNGQIAQKLVISRKTASVHVSNILRKLAVSSRVEAAAVARRSAADHARRL